MFQSLVDQYSKINIKKEKRIHYFYKKNDNKNQKKNFVDSKN